MMLLNSDIIIGAFTAALTILVYFVTRDLSKLGSIFVNYVLTVMGSLSLIVLFKGFIKPEKLKFFESTMERNNILIGIVILLIYLIFLPLVGFLPSSYCFYFVFIFSRRGLYRSRQNSIPQRFTVPISFFFRRPE
ncbi:MAG: hypothetical protein P8X90_22185 [Desulfobacterales bacterium]